MNNSKVIISCLSICFCMFIGVENALAQNKSTFDLLNNNNKEWYMQIPPEKKITGGIFFSKTECIKALTYNGERAEVRNPYYLSDEIVSQFDSTKVGKPIAGKYIVVNSATIDPEKRDLDVYEILELTSSSMKLKKLSNNTVLPYTSFQEK